MTITANPRSDSEIDNDSDSDAPIYYFGYGPMVHPSVRQRRGIQVTEEQPAVLRDHRLTFTLGVASVVPQRGWDTHGVVMRCQSQSDWDKLRVQETGFCAAELEVLPYKRSSMYAFDSESCPFSSEQDSEDGDRIERMPPIRAFVFVMNAFDQDKLDRPIERLPQERYLRLIAAGMLRYEADEAYIESEILGIPFSPSLKPHEYLQFPRWELHHTSTEALPRISFGRYQEFCRRVEEITVRSSSRSCHSQQQQQQQQQQQDDRQQQKKVPLCFIIGKHVIWIPLHDPEHAGSMWLRKHGLGKPDVCFPFHIFVIDPDVPFCETPEQVTPAVQSWAESQMVISVAAGLDAYRTLEIVDTVEEESPGIEQLLATLLQGAVEDFTTTDFHVETTQSATNSTPSSSCEYVGQSPKRGRRRGSTGLLHSALKRLGTGNRNGNGTGNRLWASTNTNDILVIGKGGDADTKTSPPQSPEGKRKKWTIQILRSNS